MARPRPALIAVLFAWLCSHCLAAGAGAAEGTGSVEGTVTLEAMTQPPVGALYRARTRSPILEPDPPRAIVYLEPADGPGPRAAAGEPVMVSQQGYQFRPGLLAVPVGTDVGFPNRDDEFHNVFSYSSVKRFDLGRFRKDEESPLVTFDQPGVVRVYCEIHKHMRSLILVLETPWHTATDHDGRFRLDGVPPGDYRLRVFLPSERTLDTEVAVQAGAVTRVTPRGPSGLASSEPIARP